LILPQILINEVSEDGTPRGIGKSSKGDAQFIDRTFVFNRAVADLILSLNSDVEFFDI
jgi:hypothetical protein